MHTWLSADRLFPLIQALRHAQGGWSTIVFANLQSPPLCRGTHWSLTQLNLLWDFLCQECDHAAYQCALDKYVAVVDFPCLLKTALLDVLSWLESVQ